MCLIQSLANSHSKTAHAHIYSVNKYFSGKSQCGLTRLRCKCTSAANAFYMLNGVFISSLGETALPGNLWFCHMTRLHKEDLS